MTSKKLRVFIGPIDVVNICAILAVNLREKGIKVTTAAKEASVYYPGTQYDVILDFKNQPATSQ